MTDDTTTTSAPTQHGQNSANPDNIDFDGFDLASSILGDMAESARQAREQAEAEPPPPTAAEALAAAEAAVMENNPREQVNVGLVPIATEWLRAEVGSGELSHLYRRAGRLVRITDKTGDEGTTYGSIDPVGVDELTAEVNYRYRCVKMKDNEITAAMFPPEASKQAVNAAYLLPNALDIKAVIETPVFRPDGSLIVIPGYDETTGVLYRPKDPIAFNVPEDPTPEEIADAVLTLNYPVARFPFVEDADRANWFGALLTPLLALAVPGPYKLVLMQANQQGSGKTFLAEIIRTLYGGPFHAEYPRNSDDLAKLVTADLMTTTGLVPVFDNVKGTLGGGSLAALLTSRTWGARILGKSATTEADNNRLWVATGNNVQVDDDMARRVLAVRIETTEEHPENRVFDLDPVQWVRDNRSEYINAAATVVRAWFAAGGKTGAEGTSGDIYHRWRTTMAAILGHGGIAGGFDGATTRFTHGHEKDEWGVFLEAIYARCGNRSWTTKQLAEYIRWNRIDSDLIPADMADKMHKDTFSRTIAGWLRRRKRSVARNLMAVEAGENRQRKVLWAIVHHNEEPGEQYIDGEIAASA